MVDAGDLKSLALKGVQVRVLFWAFVVSTERRDFVNVLGKHMGWDEWRERVVEWIHYLHERIEQIMTTEAELAQKLSNIQTNVTNLQGQLSSLEANQPVSQAQLDALNAAADAIVSASGPPAQPAAPTSPASPTSP